MQAFREAQEADEARRFGEVEPVEAVEHQLGPEHVEVDTTDYARPMLGDPDVPAFEQETGSQLVAPANERVTGTQGLTSTQAAYKMGEQLEETE
jgi:hypothetical protein